MNDIVYVTELPCWYRVGRMNPTIRIHEFIRNTVHHTINWVPNVLF